MSTSYPRSPAARPGQIEALWGTLSHAVEEGLGRTGGFAPAGAVMYPDGRIETVIAASWTDVPALLEDEVRRRVASGCVATVRAARVQAQVAESPEPLDGILVRFDNDAGTSQANFMAYTVEDGQVSYGNLHGQEGRTTCSVRLGVDPARRRGDAHARRQSGVPQPDKVIVWRE